MFIVAPAPRSAAVSGRDRVGCLHADIDPSRMRQRTFAEGKYTYLNVMIFLILSYF